MILFRADANSNIGMGHVMRCLSIADALSANTSFPSIMSGKQDIRFVLADQTVADLIKSRGYEPIVLNTEYDHMDDEISVWEKLLSSIDANLIIVDSYFVTDNYLTWLTDNIATVAYVDDVLSFPYPIDILIDYGAHITAADYHRLYEGQEEPKFILGMEYTPLRAMFQNIPAREQKRKITDILLSTGGSDELHIALAFIKHLCESSIEGVTYHILIGAMNPDKKEIRILSAKNDYVVFHEAVTDMRSLISGMDICVSAAGSTLYEICACGVPLITFSTADNQVPGAEAFSSLGLAENIGDLREPSSIIPGSVISGTLSIDAVDRIMVAVNELSEDLDKRIIMATKQRLTIDGHGAERLAQKLFSLLIQTINKQQK